MKRGAHYTASLSKNYEDTFEEMLLTMCSSFVCILDSSQRKYIRVTAQVRDCRGC